MVAMTMQPAQALMDRILAHVILVTLEMDSLATVGVSMPSKDMNVYSKNVYF